LIEKTSPVEYLYVKALIKKIIKSKNVYNIFPESGIIFIHIPKTGGTSVKKLLLNLKNPELSFYDKVKYYYFEEIKRKNLLSRHGKAVEYLNFFENDIWRDSLKFTCVRNPWDLMVSSYHWWIQHGHKFSKLNKMYTDISKMSFNEYMHSKYGKEMINECSGNAQDWFLNDSKKIIVDGVIKLENFNFEFKELLDKSNKKLNGDINLSKENTTIREKYQTYYNENTKQIINDRFKFLIEYCNYKFD